MYKAIRVNAVTLIPEVIDVDFEIKYSENLKSDWIYVTKGGVTGYESAEVRRLVQDYPDRSVFATWTACMGTLNRYHRLDIPISEVIKFLKDQGLIETKEKYGYITEVIWKDV